MTEAELRERIDEISETLASGNVMPWAETQLRMRRAELERALAERIRLDMKKPVSTPYVHEE